MSSTSCLLSATAMFYLALRDQRQPGRDPDESQFPDGESQILATRDCHRVGHAGCGPSFREARLTQPVSMSPMADATVSVEAGRVFVTDDVVTSGMIDDSALAVELGITNGGAAPYTLSAASIWCWMELSPDAPGETLSLTPAGGGEGDFPKGLSLEDQQLGSTTIPPGETRHYWVVFRGYRYPGSDAPRRISVLLPDARGRRIRS